MSKLLFTVEEIFSNEIDGYLNKNNKKFYNIPVYQRGYKWNKSQVRKLLEDIGKFEPDNEKFYCLQNITLVPNKDTDIFNVVDGQQRLTTLVVLLSFLGKQDLVSGKVRFPDNSIREQTNVFINEIITSDVGVIDGFDTWDKFIAENSSFDHQDIFYLFNCHKTIEEWFKETKIVPQRFLEKLLTSVRFIVNNISDDSKEEKIFGNLNSKRIPLDGADLVRATLITRVANEEGKRAGDVKNIVRVNERRIRIGWELDEISNWWNQTEVKDYFRRFHSIDSEEISPGNKLFRIDKFPINRLLLLFAEKSGEESLTLDVVERRSNDTLGLYQEILKLHTTLVDWYSDRKIYHYLGLIFSQKFMRFVDVWELWNASDTRQEFYLSLKKKIEQEIFKKDYSDNIKVDINWYEENQEQLLRVLLLLDIIWCLRSDQAFLPAQAFVRHGYDIEHIFPQNPKEVKDKKEYIQFLNNHVLKRPKRDLEKLFDAQYNDPTFIEKVDEFIAKHTSEIKIHSIGNLVLLEQGKNRSLKNNTYSFKRSSLIRDINRGQYIRPHTLKVFVRYFETGTQESHDGYLWTNKDIDANAAAITSVLTDFFIN